MSVMQTVAPAAEPAAVPAAVPEWKEDQPYPKDAVRMNPMLKTLFAETLRAADEPQGRHGYDMLDSVTGQHRFCAIGVLGKKLYGNSYHMAESFVGSGSFNKSLSCGLTEFMFRRVVYANDWMGLSFKGIAELVEAEF
jgi:hypothetical protein